MDDHRRTHCIQQRQIVDRIAVAGAVEFGQHLATLRQLRMQPRDIARPHVQHTGSGASEHAVDPLATAIWLRGKPYATGCCADASATAWHHSPRSQRAQATLLLKVEYLWPAP